MRKLDATVTVDKFGEAGARLTIKTRGGEGFIVDLTPEDVCAKRDALNEIVTAPAAAVFAPKAEEPAPAAPNAKKSRAKK
jgi:hypothetical protein